MNRQGLLAVCLVALVALAGCAGGIGGGTTTDGTSTTSSGTTDGTTTEDGGSGGSGTVVTYVSDRPAAIDDFAHLNATVTRIGLHRVSADANASGGANASSGDGETVNASGWQTVEVNETVDLTELRGETATHIVNQTVPSGTYDNVFVSVSNVEGTLTDGSSAEVKLPSGKLHLATTFTVEANGTVDFVYDLAIHETGNGRYILRPNAGESGADQPIRVVGDGGANAAAGVDLGVAENDSANASGSVDLTVRETVSAEGDGTSPSSEDGTTTTNETTTTNGTLTASGSAEATANISG